MDEEEEEAEEEEDDDDDEEEEDYSESNQFILFTPSATGQGPSSRAEIEPSRVRPDRPGLTRIRAGRAGLGLRRASPPHPRHSPSRKTMLAQALTEMS